VALFPVNAHSDLRLYKKTKKVKAEKEKEIEKEKPQRGDESLYNFCMICI